MAATQAEVGQQEQQRESHHLTTEKQRQKRICVLGANSFVGKNLLRLADCGGGNTTTETDNNKGSGCRGCWVGVTRKDFDFLDQRAVEEYFYRQPPYDVVIHCAMVGGSRLGTEHGEVTHQNILMFENVVRVLFRDDYIQRFRTEGDLPGDGEDPTTTATDQCTTPKLIYFSSGAALRGDPPTDPYGLSKWIIDHRIGTIDRAYSLRIWGTYGPDEWPTRFSAVCRRTGRVVIEQDRYFDFIDIEDVKQVVMEYIDGTRTEKECNLTYTDKFLLSEWAKKFGATYEIQDTSTLGPSYISTPTSIHPGMPRDNPHATGIGKKAPTTVHPY